MLDEEERPEENLRAPCLVVSCRIMRHISEIVRPILLNIFVTNLYCHPVAPSDPGRRAGLAAASYPPRRALESRRALRAKNMLAAGGRFDKRADMIEKLLTAVASFAVAVISGGGYLGIML